MSIEPGQPHITGTTGLFGATAAVGKLLGLDEQRMAWALSLTATQPVGLREMFGKTTPRTGLDGKFSVDHSAAAAIIHGRAGEGQYSDEAVRDPDTVRLRGKIPATVDPAKPADAVHITLSTTDGRTLTKHVDHAIGSLERPMRDADLDAKFLDLVDAVLPAERGHALLAAGRDLEGAPDVGAIARAAAAV